MIFYLFILSTFKIIVQILKMKKIIFTGPESTGKTTMASTIANFYNCDWVPEEARSYLAQLDRDYNENDLLQIAKKQYYQEQRLFVAGKPFLFCDTSLLVIKIWSEYKYKRCHPWIVDTLMKNKPSLYFLCNVDVPWEADILREHPNEVERLALFKLYQKELHALKMPYIILRGKEEKRIQKVKDILTMYR